MKHHTVVVERGGAGIGHEEAGLGVLPIDRFGRDGSAPGREARGERDVTTEAFGAVDRVVEKQLRERLVDELALGTQPAALENKPLLDAEEFGCGVLRAETHHAPAHAGPPWGRVEHIAAIDQLVRVTHVGTVLAPPPLDETLQAVEHLETGELGKVQLAVEDKILPVVAAGSVLALGHAEVSQLPAAAELDSAVLKDIARTKPVTGECFTVPPRLEPGVGLGRSGRLARHRRGAQERRCTQRGDGGKAGKEFAFHDNFPVQVFVIGSFPERLSICSQPNRGAGCSRADRRSPGLWSGRRGRSPSAQTAFSRRHIWCKEEAN